MIKTDLRRVGDNISIDGAYQHTATFSGPAPQRFWHQKRFDESVLMLAARQNMHVLDVGCGSGVLAHRLAVQCGSKVIGIDSNPSAIKFAREQYFHANLTFQFGRVDEIDFPPNSFDRIAFLEVIEHVYEGQARAILKIFRRLLRPGGRLVISTPNLRSLWPIIEWTLDRIPLTAKMKEEQHVTGYHSSSLAGLIATAGFKLVESRQLFVLSPWVAAVSWRCAEKLYYLERRSNIGSLLVQAFN
jgi:2-polyprenyl-3-methyl-5-hydroxy-6-metoxy-1,4-benzoquinol methylase